MPNKTFVLAVSVVLSVSLSACGTAGEKRLASDTAPSRDLSSWCQGDRAITYAQADEAGQDDPGNQFDTDETVEQAQEHNARYHAACERDDELQGD